MIKCIFTKQLDAEIPNFNLDGFILYPEKQYNSLELFENCYGSVVTSSPLVVGHYRRKEVLILRNGVLEVPYMETFGCGIEVLFKTLLEVRTTINTTSVNAIRAKIKQRDEKEITQEELMAWLDKIGDSCEKAYLKSKLGEK